MSRSSRGHPPTRPSRWPRCSTSSTSGAFANLAEGQLLVVGGDGKLTGKVEHPLCFGHGKLVRARRLAEELGFKLEEAVFYTDSITDLPLLEAVGERVCVNPDPRLRRLARARGWKIERW